jgi:hypothetical protein
LAIGGRAVPSLFELFIVAVGLICAQLQMLSLSSATEPLTDSDRLAHPGESEDWASTSAASPTWDSCKSLDRSLVKSVVPAERAEAIARLERSAVIPICEDRAAKLIGWSSDRVSARDLIAAEIARLQERRDRQLNERVGGWSLADRDRLEKLLVLKDNSEVRMLMPFLARGIAVYELTGGFSANICNNTLWISHGSLGAYRRPARVPVVIFLQNVPENLYLSAGTAR